MTVPLHIRMHAADNVAIVANDGGLPAGTVFAFRPQRCVEQVPQGHKVALVDIAEGGDGAALQRRRSAMRCKPIAAGSWVHERLLKMPAARELDGLPIATVKPPPQPPLEGYTFEGYRNAGRLGRHAQHPGHHHRPCSAWPASTDFAVQRIKAELLPKFPNVDDVVGAGAQLRLRRGDRRARTRSSRSARCATSASTPTSAAR